MNRVVITGLGVASPVGTGVPAFWANLCAGRSGIRPISLFDASGLPVRIGGEVRDLDVAALSGDFPTAAGQRDRKVLLGLAAAREAVRDSGLPDESLAEAMLAAGVGLEVFFLQDVTPLAHATNPGRALAQAVAARQAAELQTPVDRLATLLGDRFGLAGGRVTNCSACAAGSQVVGDAFHLIRDGEADVALAGASDSMLNPLGLGGFSLLRVLSTENDQPATACRPFDASRKGTVLGEGSGFVVLESLRHAQARGARVYAELLGYGSSMDAFRVSDPEPTGRGAVLSMSAALADARLSPGQIDCVNAHGTGTPKNDVVETSAIKDVLGPRAKEIPVHAVKSMTGHLIAASGAVEAVVAAMTLHAGVVPPTINVVRSDPECELDYVPGRARPFAGATVLSNSFGFGGQNATLIFARCAGQEPAPHRRLKTCATLAANRSERD